MDVSAEEGARIPAGNLHVPNAQFIEVWATAEKLNREQVDQGLTDWYLGSVVASCRWLAGAAVHKPDAPPHSARSPVSGRREAAYEELIEAEYLAAERLSHRRPDLVADRPGWCEGIQRTLRWAWRNEEPPPVASDMRSAG